jgi:hypothetical protein
MMATRTACDQDGAGRQGDRQVPPIQVAVFPWLAGEAPRQGEGQGQAGQAATEGGDVPQPGHRHQVLRRAHGNAERQDRPGQAASRLPPAGRVGHQQAAGQGRDAQKQGGQRRQRLLRQAGRRHQCLERGAQRAKGDRPAVADGGDQDGGQRREAQPDQDRGDHRHGHAKTADALQERSEHPADDQGLHTPVGGQVR